MNTPTLSFVAEIESILKTQGTNDPDLASVLEKTLKHFDCVVGTIHALDPATGMLKLLVQRGIPGAILDRVRMIPVGKGMAGLAAERREPVQVCNLQTDASGVAKPGAKETKMEGSISFPMLVGGQLRGTMGVAKPVPYEFTPEETGLLMEIGRLVGQTLGR